LPIEKPTKSILTSISRRWGTPGIDDVVDEQHWPPGKAGGDFPEKLHRTAALLGETIAAQPHELDLGPGARTVQRAGEIGDKHRGTLEQPDHNEIGRNRARDLHGERVDPGGDLHRGEQNAHPTQDGFAFFLE
jgi:hypothetical protein